MGRQPSHTFYGGAHLFRPDVARQCGDAALRTLDEYAPDAAAFGSVFGLSKETAERIRGRVVEKLRREPVEDFRIDFEEGYGIRPDAEEDAHAKAAAAAVSEGAAAHSLPPFLGIRVKPFTDDLVERGLRTLRLFFAALGPPPVPFVVTLPKITAPRQVSRLADALTQVERKIGVNISAIGIDLTVGTPQALFAPFGGVALPRLVGATKGRCRTASFDTYDFTAACGIAAHHQGHAHPLADFARHAMQVSLERSDVRLSDGATTVLPVPPHAEAPYPAQREENRVAVHRAWSLHYHNVRRSLAHGFHQGWDLHPAQLPARFAALNAFFLEGLADASARLKNFLDETAKATRIRPSLDVAATGQGLLDFFLRGLSCGALSEEDAQAAGLTPPELATGSFAEILRRRR